MKRTIVASTIVSALLLAFGCAEDNHGRLDQLDESLPAPQPVEVTKENMDEVIIKGGFHSREDVYLNVKTQ